MGLGALVITLVVSAFVYWVCQLNAGADDAGAVAGGHDAHGASGGHH